MLKKRQLSQKLLDGKLVIIQGNAKNEEDVRKVLINEKGELVDQIASGLGKYIYARSNKLPRRLTFWQVVLQSSPRTL